MFKNLQPFLETGMGKAAIAVVLFILLILLGLIRTSNRQTKKVDIKAMTFSALMIALSTILGMITLYRMPQGGSVTAFRMLPIVLVGYYYGMRRGIIAGACLGFLDLTLNPFVIHPLQLLIDYPVAFGALGLSGAFHKKSNSLLPAYIIAVIGRWFFATLSGAIYFPEYAPEGFNGITWSLWYNFTYLGAEGLLTVIVLSIPILKHTFEDLKVRL